MCAKEIIKISSKRSGFTVTQPQWRKYNLKYTSDYSTLQVLQQWNLGFIPHWKHQGSLIKWLLQGEMCCVFRDAIVHTAVVTSVYWNSWCLYGLQPVSRHQQGIFLLHNYHWVFCVAADHNPGGVCVWKSAGNEPGTKWAWKIALFGWQPPKCSAQWAVHCLEVPGLNSDLLSPSVIRSSLDRCSLTNEELRWMDEGLRLHCRFLLSHFAIPLYY